MAAYRRVYDSVTCRLTAKNRDPLRNPTLGNRVWASFTFFNSVMRNQTSRVVCVRFVCVGVRMLPACSNTSQWTVIVPRGKQNSQQWSGCVLQHRFTPCSKKREKKTTRVWHAFTSLARIVLVILGGRVTENIRSRDALFFVSTPDLRFCTGLPDETRNLSVTYFHSNPV